MNSLSFKTFTRAKFCFARCARFRAFSDSGVCAGFACEKYVARSTSTSGTPLNSDADLMLDGGLRKLNSKQRVPRLSVKAADASCCLAVVLPLIKVSGRWSPDPTKAP